MKVRWLAWKQPLLPFLTQPGSTSSPQKAEIRNSLNSILVKANRNYIIINFVTLRLTKVKFMKIISFCHFWLKSGKNLALMSFMWHFWLICLKFPLCKTTTLCFKRYSPGKIWKKPINNAFFFCVGFQWNMFRIQLILITLKLQSSSSEKKVDKTSQNYHFWTQKRNCYGPQPNKKTNFFTDITKPDNKLSKVFYFINIYIISFGWVMNVFLFCVMRFW